MKNKKELGQHWLKNREILEEIAELAVVDEGTKSGMPVCVEIGPGLGTLTSSLLKRFPRVLAVEYDADLAKKLPGQFPGKNLEVVNEDILVFDFGRAGKNFVVAGNIPYYITSPIVKKLLGLEPLPRKIVLLMQREVAERIAAERESLLSLEVKNRATVELGPVVRREEFVPAPQVDSRVVVLKPHKATVGPEVMKLVKIGFVAPRKKLMHNLTGVEMGLGARGARGGEKRSVGRKFSKEELIEVFSGVGIDKNARPGDLHLTEWQKLYQGLEAFGVAR